MADAILVVHFLIAAFIVAGLVLVWIGAALGWNWVRNPWFRYVHLGAIGFVAAEALFGVMCPLTVWEDALRGKQDGLRESQRWIHAWLFYDVPPWAFTPVYVAFLAVVAWTWWRFPPRRL